MNIENVKRLASQAEEYGVAGEPRLYCDGHMICLAPAMNPKAWRSMSKAAELWEKTAGNPDDREPVRASELRGIFPLYVRYLRGETVAVAIKERFRRCFADTAEFRASGRSEMVSVYEDGRLVGIVMPMNTWNQEQLIDEYPVIPFVDDGALYHECENE